MCDHFAISRTTFYEWRRRYELEGVEGLYDRSRQPRLSPGQIPERLERRITSMREDHPRWGARRIHGQLVLAGLTPPAVSTIHAVLVRNGKVIPKTARQRKPPPQRFERPQPNDLWQIDGMEVDLPDGGVATVIDIIDDHSRYLIGATAVAQFTSEAAWCCVEVAIAEHGPPRQLLSDNARTFSGRLYQMVMEFERRLWSLGIQTINCRPRHPQTVGKLERWHRTSREYLEDDGPPRDIDHLQLILDTARAEYNEGRPHQGIDNGVPGQRYRATPKAGPVAGATFSRKVVRIVRGGKFTYSGWSIQVGAQYGGMGVEVIEEHDKVRVLFDGELLLSFSTDHPKGYMASGKPRGGPRRRAR